MNVIASDRPRLIKLGYPGLLLAVAVFASTSLLALGHLGTREAIAERRAEDLIASLDQVIPAQLRDNDLLATPLDLTGPDGEPLRVYRARQGAAVTGVAFGITAPDGYSGPISMMMGIAPDGRVLGVRVLAHAETPGLGDKIETAKSPWIRGFEGHALEPADQWAVKKDGGRFDQFTGATVTPRAVVKAVKQGLEFFHQQQEVLLAAPSSSSAVPSLAAPTPAALEKAHDTL